MPAFNSARDSYLGMDCSQAFQPKYPTHMDFSGDHMSRPMAHPSDLDLQSPDPYNYGKHAGAPGPGYQMYGGGGYYREPYGVSHQLGAPVIAPPQMDDRFLARHAAYDGHRSQRQQVGHQDRHPAEEKVAGGVSAQLDYEMEQMTDFVVDMAAGVVKPAACDRPLFRKWVLQVLNATRLPSATIILSLSYLSLRVRGESAGAGGFHPTERGLYQMLTVALILGSKFLDDNTFQNKSWAEVSNISVRELNDDERRWLCSFGHRLHYDGDAPDGFTAWQGRWDMFRSQPVAPSRSLHPLDTALRGSGPSGRQSSSPSRYSQHYRVAAVSSLSLESARLGPSMAPTHSPGAGWYARSPSTAPHTGPTTPDYYGGGPWISNRAYAPRDATYEFATLPHFTPSFQPLCDVPSYDYVPSVWNCHGQACQCGGCRGAHLPEPRYGPIMAA